ncbi:hypothetical protein LBMAG21_14600 [Armatimonadota bacterium]|nr:hypothetical protein LBMAG21_14600 [Armatimonadota bacterium]
MVKVDYATTKAQWLTPVKADVWESLWPPDGKRIAYIACDDKMSRVAIPKYMDEITARIGRQRLWVMNADGTHKLQLTNDTNYHESTPRWSGNSAEIQFERTTNPTMNQMRSLWAIGAEGKGLHWLKDLPPLE